MAGNQSDPLRLLAPSPDGVPDPLLSQDSVPDPLLSSMSSHIARRFYAQKGDSSPLIPKVRRNIREVDGGAYDPRFMSIGPYHHGDPILQGAQDHKWRYAHDLFSRNLKADNIVTSVTAAGISTELEKFVRKARECEAGVRRRYSESIDMESDEFVEMAVLDACFVLELLIKFYAGDTEDPIFSVPWIFPEISQDLLKLENQLPFFLLEQLFDLVLKPPTNKVYGSGSSFSDPSLRLIAFHYLACRRSCNDPSTLCGIHIHHLLHLYDWILLPTSGPVAYKPKLKPMYRSKVDRGVGFNYSESTIPSATDLRKAGVKFRQRSEAEGFLNISFRGNVLKIPPLSFLESTNTIFRNLIAFEQRCRTEEPLPLQHFTSYALFLGCIVSTPDDVAMLREKGIVENKLGSDEDVVWLLNQLCREVIIDYSDHHFVSLFVAVNSYYRSKFKNNVASKKKSSAMRCCFVCTRDD